MEIKVVGDTLTIKATLGKGTPSASGKTLVVATTNGFKVVEGYKVSLNVIKAR
jgi:phosphosulfolactate phosphohydrolase-like enzyme